MELQAVTGQLYILNGEILGDPAVPGLLVQSPPGKAAHSRARDHLFVHLTLSGQPEGSADLAQELVGLISREFYKTAGSVTAALRKAILAANQVLLRQNLSGKALKREGALVCAVLRGQELFMAQAGEAFALLGHNFGVERLPATEPARATPLGRTAGLDLRYYHHWLQPGNSLLLPDLRLAHVPIAALAPALSGHGIEAGLGQLARHIGGGTARLTLVEFSDEAPGKLPEAARSTAPSRRAEPVTLPLGQPIRQADAAASRPTAPRQAPPTVPTLPDEQPAEPFRPSGDGVGAESATRRATAQTALGLSRATAWLADLLRELRPGRRQAEESEPAGWALPALLAVLIPLIVAVIVTSVYLQRGRVVEYSQIRQQVRQNLALAQQAPDPPAARAHYQQVVVLADQAQTIRAGDPEIRELRLQAQTALDRIDGVTRLTSRSLFNYSDNVALSAIVLREGEEGDLYVLDRANNQVYAHETDETYLSFTGDRPAVILFGDQVVGSHVVGNIVDMIWRPRGSNVNRDGLAILDSRGMLITFFPGQLDSRAAPLGLASDWRQPTAVATFNERLYVLDRGGGEIWRYLPQGEGFILDENLRILQFDGDADLEQVVDLDIYSEDGSVLLLYGDGRLRRYANGRLIWGEADLARNGLETPLVAPVSLRIVGRGLNSSIFVADPGSGRIVQLALGGTFLAQFKATLDGRELFAGTADFAVAEAPLRIFSAGGNQLVVATQD